jgi:hypothetical protein
MLIQITILSLRKKDKSVADGSGSFNYSVDFDRPPHRPCGPAILTVPLNKFIPGIFSNTFEFPRFAFAVMESGGY